MGRSRNRNWDNSKALVLAGDEAETGGRDRDNSKEDKSRGYGKCRNAGRSSSRRRKRRSRSRGNRWRRRFGQTPG